MLKLIIGIILAILAYHAVKEYKRWKDVSENEEKLEEILIREEVADLEEELVIREELLKCKQEQIDKVKEQNKQ